MRYLGNKTKILPYIEDVIKKYHIKGKTFADIFAGTSSVGDYFKDKYEIISNDFMFYSYVLSKAKLSFDSIPKFTKFKKKYKTDIYDWLNEKEYIMDETFFVTKNYTPVGGRMFFMEKNGIKIDGIRQEIEKIYNDDLISEEEYYFLIASLLESVTKVSNTSGTFEAYFKFWESRAEKDFILEPLVFNEKKLFSKNTVFCEDTNKLVRKIEGDIVYIDTPYTVTQYVSAYHFFETLAKYDSPEIKGVGGKRDRENKNSLYARKNEAKNQFEDMFRQLNFKHVIVSYSNQGVIPVDELIDLAKHFAKDNKVYVEKINYQEYQNHRSSNKRNGEKLNEIIIYFEKNIDINKSPLNYSGSKDKIVSEIIKYLPYHIENFVDVMGGAFNVGSNIFALNSVTYNEINPMIYKIIFDLMNTDKKEYVKSVEKYISKYKLEKRDKDSFNNLKEYYNCNKDDSIALFVLHMYAFQNMIRFNSNQEFNTPIGVAGYSNDMKNRILNFNIKSPNLILSNEDFENIKWDNYSKDTVFYFDPPYYITTAGYNDGKRGGKGWTLEQEENLLKTLEYLHKNGYKFILSNVIKHKEKEHTLLIDWVNKNKFSICEIGISGWRYSKNEVLIFNY